VTPRLGGNLSPQAPSAAPARRDPTPEPSGPPPEDSYEPDEPDDAGLPPGPPELTGMDLIQRELGGQIISEIDA
jgi:DNA polymerase-3 subunit gamma/tau